MQSHFARRLLKRLASRRSAARGVTQRLTGFEPLEPRTVLSAAASSHFMSDDFASHGKSESHGMGAYERELHSAAEVNRGPSGKGAENERYVEAPRYEPSGKNISNARDNDEGSRIAIGRRESEPTSSTQSTILSEPPAEGEQEPAYSLPSTISNRYTEEREAESSLSSSMLSGAMARYRPEPASYSAPNSILSDSAEEHELPVYSAPSAALNSVLARAADSDASPAPVLSYVPKVDRYTEVIVVRPVDVAPAIDARVIAAPMSVVSSARITVEAIASVTVNYLRSFVPVFVVVASERRLEGPISIAYAGLREYVSYASPARLSGSLTLAADTEDAGEKATGFGLSSFVMSLGINPSSLVPADAADRAAAIAASGDDRLEGQAAAQQADGDETGGLIDVESADLLRQKRKAAVDKGLARGTLSSQLGRLADLPAIREAPLLLREIMQLASDAVMTSLPAGSFPVAAEMHDDGMIELLAADLASLASRGPAADSAVAVPARAITLEAGVVAYQTFDLDAASGDMPQDVQAAEHADLPVATDRLAGAE